MAKLVVLYPQPTDATQFETDYTVHLKLLHEKTGIPESERPYSITKFADGPDGKAPFYQMFSMPFPSHEAMMSTLASQEMQEVAADAVRISTGGPPVIMTGADS